MPIVLKTPEEVELWLTGSLEVALELQKPANDDAIVLPPRKPRPPDLPVGGWRHIHKAPRVILSLAETTGRRRLRDSGI
jgi:hypothetical protein